MAKDPIVDEVRLIRAEQAAEYSYDLTAILAAARKRQQQSGKKVVSYASKKKVSA